MYIVACARCQTRLTEQTFTNYAEAAAAASRFGYPVGNGDDLWCSDCAAGREENSVNGSPTYTRRTA